MMEGYRGDLLLTDEEVEKINESIGPNFRLCEITPDPTTSSSSSRKKKKRGEDSRSGGHEKRARSVGVEKLQAFEPLTGETALKREKSNILEEGQWLKSCEAIIYELYKYEGSKWFLNPVNPELDGVPDYFEKIRLPMDLCTVNTNLIRKKTYNNPYRWQQDVRQIFYNAMTYHPVGHAIREDAFSLALLFEKLCRSVEESNSYAFFPDQRELLSCIDLSYSEGEIRRSGSRINKGVNRFDSDLTSLQPAKKRPKTSSSSARSRSTNKGGRSRGAQGYTIPSEFLTNHVTLDIRTYEAMMAKIKTAETGSSKPRASKSKSGNNNKSLTTTTSSSANRMCGGDGKSNEKSKEGSNTLTPILSDNNHNHNNNNNSNNHNSNNSNSNNNANGDVPAPPPVSKLGTSDKPLSAMQRKNLHSNMARLSANQRKAVLQLIQYDLGIYPEDHAQDPNFMFDVELLSIEKQKRISAYILQMARLNSQQNDSNNNNNNNKSSNNNNSNNNSLEENNNSNNNGGSNNNTNNGDVKGVNNNNNNNQSDSASSISSLSFLSSSSSSSDSSSSEDESTNTKTTGNPFQDKKNLNVDKLPRYTPTVEEQNPTVREELMGRHADFLGDAKKTQPSTQNQSEFSSEEYNSSDNENTTEAPSAAWGEWKSKVILQQMVKQREGAPIRTEEEARAEGLEAQI